MSSRFRASARVILAVSVLLALGAVAPAAVGVAAAPALAPAAGPVTFTVNSTNDIVADFTGDPNFDICRTNVANTVCTLRAAIMNANRHTGGAIIHLPGNLTYTLIRPATLPRSDANGGLEISNTLTLLGDGAAGTIVDGGALDSVFIVRPGTAVTLTGLTIRNGNAPGLNDGGGIVNDGQLNLTASVLRDNSAGFGGGLANSKQGTATLTNDTLTHNQSGGLGGGILNNGSLALNASTLDHNTANSGGGIYNEGLGTLTLFDSTLSNNRSIGNGGGLANDGSANVLHTTLAGNLAADKSAGGVSGGGILNTGSLQLANSLLSENYVSHTVAQCQGSPIVLNEYNYIEDFGTCNFTGDTAHSFFPLPKGLLGPLADNGGPTPTRGLRAGSLALDEIPATLNGPCHDPFGAAPTPDQRGVPRPVGAACDIGAFEGTLAELPYFHNLIHNGDAESNAGAASPGWVGVSDWGHSGQFTPVSYGASGGFPTQLALPAGEQGGANFFAGGNITTSTASQLVPMPPITTSIAAGAVHFVLSADLGGFGADNDQATVVLQFHQGAFPTGPLYLLGPVTAANRGNLTQFLKKSASGPVPPLADLAVVTIDLERTSGPGTYNDAYADNVSLVLLPRAALFLPLLMR